MREKVSKKILGKKEERATVKRKSQQQKELRYLPVPLQGPKKL